MNCTACRIALLAFGLSLPGCGTGEPPATMSAVEACRSCVRAGLPVGAWTASVLIARYEVCVGSEPASAAGFRAAMVGIAKLTPDLSGQIVVSADRGTKE